MLPAIEEFVSWPTEKLARFVRESEVHVAVLAIN